MKTRVLKVVNFLLFNLLFFALFLNFISKGQHASVSGTIVAQPPVSAPVQEVATTHQTTPPIQTAQTIKAILFIN